MIWFHCVFVEFQLVDIDYYDDHDHSEIDEINCLVRLELGKTLDLDFIEFCWSYKMLRPQNVERWMRYYSLVWHFYSTKHFYCLILHFFCIVDISSI